ncbi:MAG: tail fiber domain-containing protein, partial [Bacteroidota bacterium]
LFSLNATAQWTYGAIAVYLNAANAAKKVGIGTSTPSAKLHVKGGDFRLDNNAQFFDFKVDATGNLKIQRNGTATAMIIGDNNGNVGIGTTTVPSAKLHVKDGDFRLDRGGQYFDFKVDAAGNLKVERNGTTTAMIIGDNNGNVGIGTTTVPSAKLHVRNGDFRLDNNGQWFDFKVSAVGNLKIERNGTTNALEIGDGSGSVGLGGAPNPLYRLKIYGSALASGGTWVSSDKRFKNQIQTLDGALDKVLALRGAEYVMRTDDFKHLNFNSGKQIGFIAQELQAVLPELVQEDEGYLAVNYDGVVPVLVEAMKEQQAQIEEKEDAISALQTQLSTLETRLAHLEQLLSQGSTGDRSDAAPAAAGEKAEGITIFPNPNKGNFTVCFEPVEKNATVVVLDLFGREVSRQSVETGASQAKVNLQGKPAGSYFCQLKVLGKPVAYDTTLLIE